MSIVADITKTIKENIMLCYEQLANQAPNTEIKERFLEI